LQVVINSKASSYSVVAIDN